MATIAVQLGIAVVGTVLNALFAPKPPDQEGPRLNDLNLPSVNPGNPVVRVFGSPVVGTQIIWGSGLRETKTEEKVGGKGGPSQTVISYTYDTDVAMGVCEGVVTRFRRIWANNKVLYSAVLVSGDDATTVTTASTLCRTISAQVSTAIQKTDNNTMSTKEKKVFRELLVLTPDRLDYIGDAAALASVPTVALNGAWDDLKGYLDGLVPPVTQDGSTPINEDTLEGFLEAFQVELDDMADALYLAAVGSSNAYLDGVAISDAQNSIDTIGGFAGGAFAALSAAKQSQNETDIKQRYSRINIYTGTETQLPDDIIEASEGAGLVPAYRGLAYFVLEELQLADFGNTLPTFKVEVESGDVNGEVQLQDVIESLCLEAGLEEDEFNVLNLPNRPIKGIAITRVGPAREVMEMLRNLHHFDVTESNYQLRFIWRYGPPDARIRPEDMSAVEFDSDPITPVEITRQQIEELPREIVFKYQDPTRDYSTGIARAKRSVTNNNQVDQVELPVVLHPVEAKTAVEDLMTYKYATRRNYSMVVPIKYAILDPGDVCLVKTISNRPERFLRVISTQFGANHLVELQLTDYIPYVPGIAASAYVQDNVPSSAPVVGPTAGHLLDLPMLTDTEDGTIPGFYVGFSRLGSRWDGGALYLDAGSGGTTPYPGDTTADEEGADWQLVATNSNDVKRGIALSTMHDASPYLWDRTSRLRVYITTPGFIPSSQPESALVRSTANSIVMNFELMQFATVDYLGDDIYELSDFIRGKRGTDPFVETHAIGDEVLFISSANLVRYEHNANQIGEVQDYKVAEANASIANIPEFQFTSQARNLMPLAPCNIDRDDSPSGDIVISLLPRARQNGQWTDGTDVVVDQAVEEYELDIYNAAGTVFKRTLTMDATREVTYTLADQTTDFGAHVAYGGMMVKAYQIGAIVGRGFTNPIVL